MSDAASVPLPGIPVRPREGGETAPDAPWWASAGGVAALAALWGLCHAAIRLIAGPSLAFDDSNINTFTQGFQWGYAPENPPLFEWLLQGVQPVLGTGLLSILAVKYGLAVAAAAAVFAALRPVAGARTAALMALGLAALYQTGYNYHQAYTHTLALIAASAVFLWALRALLERPDALRYLAFGAAMGLGVLAKYNFLLLAVPALLAMASLRDARPVLLSPFMAAALLLAALIAAPNIAYALEQRALYAEFMGEKLGLEAGAHWERALSGAGEAVVGAVTFFLPAALFAVPLFWRELRGRGDAAAPPAAASVPSAALSAMPSVWLRAGLLGLAAILLGTAAAGVSTVAERYVIPATLPLWLWAAWRVRGASAGRAKAFAWACAGTAALYAGVRLATLLVADAPFCDPCQRWVPYPALAEAMRERGVAANATFVTYDPDTAGNLRSAFPRATVRTLNAPMYKPAPTPGAPCYFISSADLAGAPIVAAFAGHARAPGAWTVTADWTHPLKTEWGRSTSWTVSPQAPGGDFHAQFCR